VRKIIRESYLKPYEGKYRVYIIQQSERMSEEASNALLKTLEEPPEQVVIILISSVPEQILPTLVSRAQLISLKKVFIWLGVRNQKFRTVSDPSGSSTKILEMCRIPQPLLLKQDPNNVLCSTGT